MIYKDKQRNTYYFRVYVTNKNGERIQKEKSGFRTKKECIIAENNFVLNYQDTNDNILFSELYDVFIKSKEQDLKFQSFRAQKNRYKNHILPFFKNYQIKNIKASDYIEWKNQILRKNYSYTYMSSLHQAMVNILNFAMAFYDLKENIASKVGNFSKRNYMKKVNFWTFEEYQKFITKVDDIVYYTLFDFLYYTGLRLGEVRALNWNDLKDNYIRIDKNLIRSSIKECKFNTPKTNSSIRNVELDDYVLSNLKKLKEYYKTFIGFSDDWFIFGGLVPLSTTTIERKKNYYCKIANVKQIKIHEFRHSHATNLLSIGTPITVISKRLGHSNLTTTLKVYSHLVLKDEDKAIKLLNDIKSKM